MEIKLLVEPKKNITFKRTIQHNRQNEIKKKKQSDWYAGSFRLVWILQVSNNNKKKPHVIRTNWCFDTLSTSYSVFMFIFWKKNLYKWTYTREISSQSGFASIQFTWGSLCKITQFFETHLCLYHHSNVHPFYNVLAAHSSYTTMSSESRSEYLLTSMICCIHKM